MKQSFTTADGTKLAVVRRGSPNARVSVFLAHCMYGDQHEWHYQVRDLAQKFGDDIQIVTWDQRGHGDSAQVRRSAFTFALLGSDFGELVDVFAPTGDLVVAGHSMGGFTTLALASERPDIVERITGAAFVSTSASSRPGRERRLTLRERISMLIAPWLLFLIFAAPMRWCRTAYRRADWKTSARTFGRPRRDEDVDLMVRASVRPHGAIGYGTAREWILWDRTDVLPLFAHADIRVLTGDRDGVMPPRHSKRLAAALPGAELIVCEGAGHMLPLERDAEVSAALVGLIEPRL